MPNFRESTIHGMFLGVLSWAELNTKIAERNESTNYATMDIAVTSEDSNLIMSSYEVHQCPLGLSS